MVAFIVGFDWRRGPSDVVVDVLKDDAPAWRLVASPSALHEEIKDVVSELLNGGSLSLKKGRLRVIANA